MNRQQTIDRVAEKADLPVSTVEKAIVTFLALLQRTLAKGGEVTLSGFGKFSVSKRRARRGTHPKTNAPIEIPAKKVVKFTAGTRLKEAVH